jgi:hypothetical protein
MVFIFFNVDKLLILKEIMTLGIIDARIFNYSNETGLAVINNLGHIFVVNSINTPVLWRAIPSR